MGLITDNRTRTACKAKTRGRGASFALVAAPWAVIVAGLALAGCTKLPAGIPNPLQASQPPQAFLDSRILAVSANYDTPVDNITPGQIAEYYSAHGQWKKVGDGDYAFTISDQDRLTHKPLKVVLEFTTVSSDQRPVLHDPARGQSPGTCGDCIPDEPLVKFVRGLINDDEMGAGDFRSIETGVMEEHAPLPKSLLAARNRFWLAPACDSAEATALLPAPTSVVVGRFDWAYEPNGATHATNEHATRVWSFAEVGEDSVDAATGVRTCHATANLDIGPRRVVFKVYRRGPTLGIYGDIRESWPQPAGEAVLHPVRVYVPGRGGAGTGTWLAALPGQQPDPNYPPDPYAGPSDPKEGAPN